MQPGITERLFGYLGPLEVLEYTITNAHNMQVSIINYGATITRIMTADRKNDFGNVVYGFDNVDGYLENGQKYFGSIVGRYCNRIAAAAFTLNGQTYKLHPNNGANSLHGGLKGFDKVWWNIEKMPGDNALKLTYTSSDGEEGFPGNLSVQIIYRLTDANELIIDYSANTDQATPVNLTSHGYFNLSARFDVSILDHELYIAADTYTPVHADGIPTGNIESVKGGPLDFIHSKKVGADIEKMPDGYDHNYVLNKTGSVIASLYDASSGRYMEMETTAPGLQFYSGNFFFDSRNESKQILHAALCLEAQHYPNSPNEPSFPNTILQPGDTYRQTTCYRFSVR
jgi:aldose 1-epimerase